MKSRKHVMKGGVPIYPGGFSCVFKPQLRCKNKTIKIQKKEGISKLMFKKYAEIEMENIQRFYNATKKIPKSHKYFLFTSSKMCSPKKISKRDLRGFDEMCTNFTSHDVSESNINSKSNINNLKLINMPNAGLSLNEWLFKTRLTSARIIIFNKLIAKLIINAIVPMNQQGVIHNDMKEDNILIKDANTNTSANTKNSMPAPTIIDWGISGISTRQHEIPEIIMNRYISISNPFSSILFSSDFSKSYSDFLRSHDFKDPLFRDELNAFSLSQYLKFKEYGHYLHIQKFFNNAFALFPEVFQSIHVASSSSKSSPDQIYNALASNYISDVLIRFTEIDERDGVARFQYIKYFTKVYIFNCDVWGTMFCYSIFFSFQDEYKYNENIDIESSKYSSFLRAVLSIYMNQIMINGHEKINISKLVKSIANTTTDKRQMS
jgi:hypothetical protein